MKKTLETISLFNSRIWIKRATLLLLSIIFGISSALLANHLLEEKISEIERSNLTKQKSSNIIVAKNQITPGMRFDKSNLATRDIPIQWVPSYATTFDYFPQIENQISAYAFNPGDIIIPAPIDNKQTTLESKELPSSEHSPIQKKPSDNKKIIVLYGNQTVDQLHSTKSTE